MKQCFVSLQCHLQLEVIAISNWKSLAPSTGIYRHFCLEVISMSVWSRWHLHLELEVIHSNIWPHFVKREHIVNSHTSTSNWNCFWYSTSTAYTNPHYRSLELSLCSRETYLGRITYSQNSVQTKILWILPCNSLLVYDQETSFSLHCCNNTRFCYHCEFTRPVHVNMWDMLQMWSSLVCIHFLLWPPKYIWCFTIASAESSELCVW